MICLLQFLFWECWNGKRNLDCKGKECRFYGSDTCYAKDKVVQKGGAECLA